MHQKRPSKDLRDTVRLITVVFIHESPGTKLTLDQIMAETAGVRSVAKLRNAPAALDELVANHLIKKTIVNGVEMFEQSAYLIKRIAKAG